MHALPLLGLLVLLPVAALPRQQPATARSAVTTDVPADSAGAITGTVIHAQTSAPLADVHVRLIDTGREARTGTDGRFSFADVPSGNATLTFSTIGFIFVRRRVDVTAGATIDVLVPLAEGTGTYETTVTVTPTLDEPRGNVRELGPGALQDLRGVAADDPIRGVQALPGVATGDDFQSEFSVRGAAFRQTGLVIDGVVTPVLFHAVRGTEDSGSIAMINTDVLGRASLSIGPHPARDGNWLGATLAFDIREGSRTRPAVRGSVSGTSTAVVGEGPIGGHQRGSWLVSARKSYVDWLVRKIDPSIESTIGFSDMQSKVTYDLTRTQQLQFTGIGGNAVYHKPTATAANEILRATSTSAMASVALRSTTSRALFVNRLALATNYFRNTGLKEQEQAVGTSTSWIVRSDITWPVQGWTVEGGVHVDLQHEGQTLRDWVTQGNGALRLRAEQRITENRTLASGYMQFGGQKAGIGLSTGMRVAFDSNLDAHGVSPWLLVDRPIGRVILSASASHAVQFPSLELVGQAPAAPLLPERATLADAGLTYQLTSSLSWRVAGFGRRESDMLRRTGEDRLVDDVRIVASRFPTFRSSLEGSSRGMDVVLERRATRGPTGWIGYTWAHTTYRDLVSGESFDGDHDQRHTLNVFVQQRLSYRLKVHAKFRYGSNFPIVGYFEGTPEAMVLGSTRNAVRLPDYARFDINGSRTFEFTRSRLTLFVEVMNVTNRENVGPADGSIRTNRTAVNYTETLLPVVPSAGILIEF